MPARTIVLALLLFAGGCAHYEYNIVSPPTLAQHIGQNSDAVVSLDPMSYRMRSVENHLVIQVYNRADEPVRVLGEQSFVVDPGGQSHPLPTQTIGPHSFIKLILPPPPPDLPPSGPAIGFGVGYGLGFGSGAVYSDPFLEHPRYGVVYASQNAFWKWEDESDVRLSFTFQRGSQPTFTQNFVFHRQKM